MFIKKKKKKNITVNYSAAIGLFILAIAFGLGVFLTNVQKSIDLYSQQALTNKVALQGEHALSILDIHYGFLNSIADEIGKSSDLLSQENMNLLISMSEHTDFSRTALIEADGTAHYENGVTKDLSQRAYFKEAMEGKETLSDPLESSVDKETRVILGVPVYRDGQVVAAVGGSYNVTALSRMLFNDVFDDAGYSLIVTREGEIIAYDGEPAYSKITYGDNFFDFYENRTILTDNTLQDAKNDFLSGSSGLLKIRNGSDQHSDQYLAYTRLGMNDWMVCYVIPLADAQSSYDFINTYWSTLMAAFVLLVLLLVFYIIHTNRLKNEELLQTARTDGLTGTLNKRATEARINEILEQNPDEKGTFIILDVDNFKEVNDQFGHAVGDVVLNTLGETLRKQFRENDIVGRIGGDEFVIYMRNTLSKDSAISRVSALVEHICSVPFKEMYGEHITISVGVAFAPEHGSCYMDLYKNADTAMYETKQGNKNGYHVYSPNEPKDIFVKKTLD